MWVLGKVACVEGSAGTPGAAGVAQPEAIRECETPPCRPCSQGPARTGRRGVSLEGFLGYLMCVRISFTTQTAEQKMNYMVDKLVQDVGTRPRHQPVFERWERYRVAAWAWFPRRCFSPRRGLPAHDRTAQVRSPAGQTAPPPPCALGPEWIVGLEPQTMKGEGERRPMGRRNRCTRLWALGLRLAETRWPGIGTAPRAWGRGHCSCWPPVLL